MAKPNLAELGRELASGETFAVGTVRARTVRARVQPNDVPDEGVPAHDTFDIVVDEGDQTLIIGWTDSVRLEELATEVLSLREQYATELPTCVRLTRQSRTDKKNS